MIGEPEKPVTHFCVGHKKKLTLSDEWCWNKIKIGKKTAYYCNHCIYCEGCKRIHPLAENGGARGSGNPTKYWCFKWVKSTSSSPEKRADGLSPAEILSGVHLGYEGGHFKGASKETYTEIKQKNKEAVKQLG